jgi:hypothetical protein
VRATARSEIVLEDLGDEVIAYDPTNAMAHVLSPLAAGVLLLCDGEHDETDIASALATDADDVDPAVVQDAVASLGKVGLLLDEA